MTNPYMYEDMTEKQVKLRETTDNLLKHQKACDTCSNTHVCDIAADINLKVLELVYSS
jgi:hypothetical protein